MVAMQTIQASESKVERTEDGIGLASYCVLEEGDERRYYLTPGGQIFYSRSEDGTGPRHGQRYEVVSMSARRWVCEQVNAAFGTNWRPTEDNETARRAWNTALWGKEQIAG